MLGWYLLASAGGHLAWEVAQLPLYTIWHTGTAREITWAVLHCTAGDIVIALATVVAALLAVGDRAWPGQRFAPVMLATVALSEGATIVFEHLNTVVWQNWAYAAAMPTLPWLGTGMSPLAQWMVVPPLAMLWATGRTTVSTAG